MSEEAPLGLLVSLCRQLRDTVDFSVLSVWATHRIEKAKELLCDPKRDEIATALLRGEISAYKNLLNLSDIVEKTLDGVRK